MPKISLDMPAELVEDLRKHVGDEYKFVSLADAVVQPVGNYLINWMKLTQDMEGRCEYGEQK